MQFPRIHSRSSPLDLRTERIYSHYQLHLQILLEQLHLIQFPRLYHDLDVEDVFVSVAPRRNFDTNSLRQRTLPKGELILLDLSEEGIVAFYSAVLIPSVY